MVNPPSSLSVDSGAPTLPFSKTEAALFLCRVLTGMLMRMLCWGGGGC